MVSVRIAADIPAERERVWTSLSRIEDHVQWMADATAIRFVGDQNRGGGTTFECDTKVGPLRLTDTMEVTDWQDGEILGVRHTGAVSGTGRFTLRDIPGRATRVEWEEQLFFPWWLGAGVGAFVAKPIFAVLWRGNLRRLGAHVSEAISNKEG